MIERIDRKRFRPLVTAHRDGEDAWARRFFTKMLAQDLSTGEFEQAVFDRWTVGPMIMRAPETALWIRELALAEDRQPAGYASDAPHLGFTSQWLIGVSGRPGAIHIQAPAESTPRTAELQALNRPPHQHDSGRVALVTHGSAIFHVWRGSGESDGEWLDCPVETGSLIFWPAWTPHTFNAQQGFWLVSAMANYVSPAEDGFVFPVSLDIKTLQSPLDARQPTGESTDAA